jgi:hypothetical protein
MYLHRHLVSVCTGSVEHVYVHAKTGPDYYTSYRSRQTPSHHHRLCHSNAGRDSATLIEETYNSEMGYKPTTNSETYEVAFLYLETETLIDVVFAIYLYYSYIGVDCVCDWHELDRPIDNHTSVHQRHGSERRNQGERQHVGRPRR